MALAVAVRGAAQRLVVPAAHLDDLVDAGVGVAVVGRVGDGARAVEPPDQVLRTDGQAGAHRLALHLPLLVADGPHHHAGMVAIAQHQRLQLGPPHAARAHGPRLVQHQHAQAIADLQHLGRRRVVRGAVGVAAHLLEAPDPQLLQGVRDGRAHAGVVLVIAGALDDVGPAVQQESPVRVEGHAAHAERRLHGVTALAAACAARDHRPQAVQRGRLGRPEPRRRQ